MKPTVLIVEDDEATRFGLSRYLQRTGHTALTAGDLGEARRQAAARRCDAVLLDLGLPDGNGLDWIPELRREAPGIGVIVVTGQGDVPTAVEAMRRGADNFLTKPLDMDALGVHVAKAIEIRGLRRQSLARQWLAGPAPVFFGRSERTREVLELAQVATENDAPVLLRGETGTGKGVLARWIHERGDRSDEQLVEVNCSALRGELLASELFGHARGAFTSAVRDRPGLIEIADRGTLFLDEIGDMDLLLQTQILKVIEEKRFRRVGETRTRQSEFRVLCATNRDLEREVANGAFRQDLLFRINVFPIHLPPLRETAEDIAELAGHLLRSMVAASAEIPDGVLDLLTAYGWPGNVRELRNVLERGMLLARGGPLTARCFPGLALADTTSSPLATQTEDELTLEHARTTVDRFGGDLDRAAQSLGISRRTLYRRLAQARRAEPDASR